MIKYYNAFADYANVESNLIYNGEMREHPQVSIMIPTYKRPQLLKQALFSAINQNVNVPFEVIIVDNDPESNNYLDYSSFLSNLNSKNISCYRNSHNIGMYGNWNRCIELARSEWITILNDDDFLDDSFLYELIKIKDSIPNASLVSSLHRISDERYDIKKLFKRKIASYIKHKKNQLSISLSVIKLEDYFIKNPHNGSLGILFQKSKALQIGGFNTKLYPSCDYAFFSNYVYYYQGAYQINKECCTYRIRDNESLNATTTIGWCKTHKHIQRCIARKVSLHKSVKNYYINLYINQIALAGKEVWNQEIDITSILKENKIIPFAIYYQLQLAKVFLKIYFFAFSFFRSNEFIGKAN